MSGELAIFFIAVVAFFMGAGLWQKGNYLLKNGKRAQAIIFKNNYESSRNGGIYYPVVKFLTDKQEWITQELSTGSSLKRNEGSKVNVIYDPEDPHSVAIDSMFGLKILPIFLFTIGVVGFVIVVLALFDITQLIY